MRTTVISGVLCCLALGFGTGWASEESLLDDEHVTETVVEKILDAGQVACQYVSVATTDTDQDADEDILLVDALGNVRLMLNNRTKGFSKPVSIAGPVNAVPGPVSLDLSDVDLDNHEDILISSSMGEVYLVSAEGGGRYRPKQKISDALNKESGLVQVRVSDVDLDNDEDIVLATPEGALYKIENVGTGHFGNASLMVQLPNVKSGLFDFVFTDLDFDNDEEIVFIDGIGTVFVLENLGGRFGEPRHIAGPFRKDKPGSVDIEVSDYDYDGDDDLIIMGPAGMIVLLENEGKGVFASRPQQIAPPLGPEGGIHIMALSDPDTLTGEDIVVVNTKGSIFLIENRGDGVYDKPQSIAENIKLAPGPASVVREDMNGDGAEDTLILDGEGHLYLVLGVYDPAEDLERDLEDDL